MSGLAPVGATDASVDKSTDGPTPVICVPDAGDGSKSLGEACMCAAECESGNCADGVCCNTSCEGTCQSCVLPTSLGMCVLTPAGAPPRAASQCPVGNVAACGLDGTCDGTGQCRNYEPGTVCTPGVCEGDAIVSINVCDGEGHCKLGASTVCAPFSCDPATSACFPTCTSDANCVSGRKCVMGSCGPKANGTPCAKSDECESLNCVDKVCCNTACGGACRSCNLVNLQGTCSPVPMGLPHALCPKQAPTTCGTAGVCDGFGSCSFYPEDSPCGPSTCAGPTAMNTARACDGLGTCGPSMMLMCGMFRCANTACNSKCTTNADCADGIACVAGSCGPKVDGQSCAADGDCLNLHCVRDVATSATGICCNTACVGACRSCALTSHIGVCSPVPLGTLDPRRTCVDMTVATCGTNGRCDGAMGCQKYAVGAVCGAQTCAADLFTGSSTCNAAGLCTKPAASSCFPYHCNAATCFNSCTTNAQCIAPNSCGMNGMISSCGLKPRGAACAAARECLSNFCADGVCCDNSCNNSCQACNMAASRGTCTNVNSGADPNGICAAQAQSTCGTTGLCAAGACARWPAGTVCRASAGVCDTAEMCSGNGTACPANGFASATTTCRASAGGCDVAETCTGGAAACPADTLRASGFVCRGAAGVCDVQEACNGAMASCPGDGKRAAGFACADEGNVCTRDVCDGTTNNCTHPAAPAGTVCAMPANGSATCSGTTCGAITCNAGFHVCGGACAANTSVASCGTSCTACAAPANGAATCNGTACGFTCNAGFHVCGAACASNTSPNSCGTMCTPCAAPANATATCNGTTCGFTCNTGFHLCGAACVSNSSVANCGPTSCTACPVPTGGGSATCNGTMCGSTCPAGSHNCGGACVLNTSIANCGTTSCTACPDPPDNATATCSGTACGFRCNTDFHNCSGVCVSNTGIANCGPTSCTACPGGGSATCNGTTCGFTCNAPLHQCGTPAAPTCVANDFNACGAMCRICPVPSDGKPACNAGICGIVCNEGFMPSPSGGNCVPIPQPGTGGVSGTGGDSGTGAGAGGTAG